MQLETVGRAAAVKFIGAGRAWPRDRVDLSPADLILVSTPDLRIAEYRERETTDSERETLLPLTSAALFGDKSAADDVDTKRRTMRRPKS